MKTYPFIAWEKHDCEVIACGSQRYRLIYRGNCVAKFRSGPLAIRYALEEFAPSA